MTPIIEGPASEWLRARISQFCESLKGDPWGSDPPGRIVITSSYAATLYKHLPAVDYQAWEDRHRARGDQGKGVGMGFVARDGMPTVVVVALPEEPLRNELLSLVCHEICEASMASGDGPFVDIHTSMSRVLWSEHVVERRRSARFHEFGWERGALDDGHLCELLADYEEELPDLLRTARLADAVPDRLYGHWQILTREFVCTLGRARGGDDAERVEAEAFIEHQGPARQRAWRAIEQLLERLHGHPERTAAERDEQALREGWLPLFEVLRAEWNDAYG
jgi:hypothetical protein